MKKSVTFIQSFLSVILLLVVVQLSPVFAANPSITNVNGEVLSHDDGTQYVKITYTAKDFPAAGSIIKFTANCDNPTTSIKETPPASEISGDLGLVIGDGQKTILWEDEKTLVRLGKQDKFQCQVVLEIEGNENSITFVSLNVSKYQSTSWNYFTTGTVSMTVEKVTGLVPEFMCATLGNAWHSDAVTAGATFYKINNTTAFPVYRGRNSGDKFKGQCTQGGCSSFLAIKDYGKPTQIIWANFTKRFLQTQDVNGTNITQDFEFQFRYFEKAADNSKALLVVNAGKQGQQIISELNRGETLDLSLEGGKIGEAKSNTFEIEVPRREWKYFYKGNHIFTIKVGDKKSSFKGATDGTIFLDGGNEVLIGDAIKFVGVSFVIDTTPDKSKIIFIGACYTNGVLICDGVSRTINLNESLEFSTPLNISLNAALYTLAGIVPFIDRLRLEGDPNAPTGVLFDLRLIFKTFSDGCDILFHPGDNTGGIVYKDIKITPEGWELPTGMQVNNVGILNSEDWCIKNMLVAYEKPSKKFTFDILMKAPLFSDIGAGCTFIDGSIEQFKILAKLGSGGIPVPIPEPPPLHVAVWRGLELEMSNWYTGPKTLRGTMFFANQEEWKKISSFNFVKEALGDLAGWQIFEAEGTLQGNELGEFTVDGKMRILGKIDIWAAQLRGALTFQLNRHVPIIMYGFKNVGIDLVQVGGDKFILSGTINGSMNALPQWMFTGSIRGDIYIPDLFKNHPGFQLINSKLGLPIKVSAAQMMIRNTQGSIDLDLGWLGVWGLWFDFSKSPLTEGSEFMGLQNGTVQNLGGIAFKMNNKKVQANDTTFVPFTLNSPTNYAYAEIKANVQPTTFLVSPTQKIYTSTSSDSTVIFSPAASTADVGLWVLKNPELGQWKLGVIGKKTGDSIHFWAIVKQRPEFSFTTNQISRTVFCNWDNSKATDSSVVDFFIDTDDNGNDGYRIGTVDEKKGSFSYTMTDSLKECGYYIYAVRWDGDRATNFVYSPTLLSNPKVALPAPMNLSGIYTNKNIVTLSWAKSTDPTTTIYLIKVTDETGKDSLYASTNASATGIQLEVVNAGTKTFSIQSQGLNQATGCWAAFPKLTLGAEEEPLVGFDNRMEIIPNPTEANAVVRFKQSSYDKVKVVVVDLLGREVLHVDGGYMAEGIHSMQLRLSQIEQGVYFVQVVSGSNRASTIMTVIR